MHSYGQADTDTVLVMIPRAGQMVDGKFLMTADTLKGMDLSKGFVHTHLVKRLFRPEWQTRRELSLKKAQGIPFYSAVRNMKDCQVHFDMFFSPPSAQCPPIFLFPFGAEPDPERWSMAVSNPFFVERDNGLVIGLALCCRAWPVQDWVVWRFREDLILRWLSSTYTNRARQIAAVREYMDFHAEKTGSTDALCNLLEEQFIDPAPRAPVNSLIRPVPEALKDVIKAWIDEHRGSIPTTTEQTTRSEKALSIAVIARLCWCMEKAGHSDHAIVNATSAARLASRYGRTHARAGEKLKQERNRFDRPDGMAFLKGGPQSRDSYGRKVWTEVRAALDDLGHADAARQASSILSDI